MEKFIVATVLTVYGIETGKRRISAIEPRSYVATVLTVYGIETIKNIIIRRINAVATVLTVYGIETHISDNFRICVFKSCNSAYRLRY